MTLVAASGWLVAHDRIVPAVIAGFFISLVWTFNVKRVSFGSKWDRIAYASGAAFGTLIGLLVVKFIFQ